MQIHQTEYTFLEFLVLFFMYLRLLATEKKKERVKNSTAIFDAAIINTKEHLSCRCLLRRINLINCPTWVRPALTISDHKGIFYTVFNLNTQVAEKCETQNCQVIQYLTDNSLYFSCHFSPRNVLGIGFQWRLFAEHYVFFPIFRCSVPEQEASTDKINASLFSKLDFSLSLHFLMYACYKCVKICQMCLPGLDFSHAYKFVQPQASVCNSCSESDV